MWSSTPTVPTIFVTAANIDCFDEISIAAAELCCMRANAAVVKRKLRAGNQ